MNLAFMTWSTPELTLEENLDLAQRLGYDGIEPRIEGKQRHGIEVDTSAAERQAIRQKAASSGIALCCVASSLRYADPATAQEQVARTRQCIDLCADIGAPRLRVFGGGLPKDVTREQATDLLVDSLRAVGDQAAERGVTVCIETHDDWSDPRHLAPVLERVAHPAIAVNWDFLHPWWRAGMTVEESFAVVRPWIRHVHVHDGTRATDGKNAMVWIGEGEVDHRRAMELLRADGYTGYLSGEWIGRDPGYAEHLPRELATLRGYERDLAGVV